MDSSIQFAVNFMFQTLVIKDNSVSSPKSSHGIKVFPPVPTFDCKTGLKVLCQNKHIYSDSTESSIYLMHNLKIGGKIPGQMLTSLTVN